jgi:hypothetical protein
MAALEEKMRNRSINFEMGLYLLIFLIAAGIRLIGLDRNPLTNAEANLALQSLELARGGSPVLAGQPGYIVLTAALFFLSYATEFTARLLPAIAGSEMIWAAFLFRPHLGRIPALMLAFFLAVEPGLVAAARQADGLIFAAGFGLLAAGFLYRRRPVPGGLFGGLALLGGPGVWMGLLVAAMAVFSSSLFLNKKEAEHDDDFSVGITTWPWRAALPWLAGTLLILGTAFLWIPAGISALFTSLTAFFSGWVAQPVFPAGRMFVLLVGYAPLAILLGTAGIVSGFLLRQRTDQFLTIWFLTALVIVLIYPARQAPDLIWALVPLWALSARQISRWLNLYRSDPFAFAGQMTLVVVLLGFIWFSLVGITNVTPGTTDYQFYLLRIVGSVLMMLVVAILIAWGWSFEAAAGGLVWGWIAVLLVFTVSSAINAGGLGRRPDAEMWHRSPYVDQADLLLLTATNISQWNTRAQDALDLIVIDTPSSSLHWAVRDYRNARIATGLSPGTNPSMIVTPEQDQPALAASYTGQSFVWYRSPIWDGVNLLRWRAVRAAPVYETNVILWVRSDLLPGWSPALVEPEESSGE